MLWSVDLCCVLCAVFCNSSWNTSGLWPVDRNLASVSYSTTPLKQRVPLCICVTIHAVYP